MFCLVSRRP